MCILPDDDELQGFYQKDPSKVSGGSAYSGFQKEEHIRNYFQNQNEMIEFPRLFVQLNFYSTMELDGVFLGKRIPLPSELFSLQERDGNMLQNIPKDNDPDLRFFFIETKSFCLTEEYLQTESGKQRSQSSDFKSYWRNHNLTSVMDDLFDKIPKILTLSRIIARSQNKKDVNKFAIILFFNGRDRVTFTDEIRVYFENRPENRKYKDSFFPVWFQADPNVCKLLEVIREKDGQIHDLELRNKELERKLLSLGIK